MIPMDPTQAARVATFVRMCQLIPTIVALYDHLLTLDQEVELVWKKPQTLARAMFLWNRYFGSLFLLINGIISAVPSHGNLYVLLRYYLGTLNLTESIHWFLVVCHFWFIFQGCGTAIIIWSIQSTMLLRTHAMYPYSPFIRYLTRIFFICEILSMSTILAIAFARFKASNSITPERFSCAAYHIPSFLYAFWIPVIALDCIFFILAVWVILVRRSRRVGLPDIASSSPVLETLVRDSILYFIVTLLTYTANAAVWVILPARLIGLPQTFSIAGSCVMGVRLVLNLRGAYYSHSMVSVSYVESAAPDPIAFFNGATSGITLAFRAPSHVSTVSSKMESGSP